MRLLHIALALFISLSVVGIYGVSVASGAETKVSKIGAHRSHKAHSRKGKKTAAKSGDVWERIRHGLRIPRPSPVSAGFDPIPIPTTLIPTTHVNVPEPIRKTNVIVGHKASKNSSERLTTVNPSQQKPLKDNLPLTGRYTRLGRSLFEPKDPALLNTKLSRIHIKSKDHLSPKQESLFKSSSVQRIRTRLGLHPELFKHDDTALAKTTGENQASNKNSGSNGIQQQLAVRSCSDLNKQGVFDSGRQGVVESSYSQLVELCRIKQDIIYQRVNRQIAGFSQGKGFLYQSAERARPYLYHVVDALSKYGLPLDLALLPIVESGYQATALSPMNAAGIWQFIPDTGRDYGLEQNDEYDARLDVTASTQAAIRFLSGLNSHFKGDWLLTLAAYNSGQGTVDAAIVRNLAEGLDTDYWSLDLPEETQNYVPRLLALSSIFSNPGAYGLKLKPVKNELHFIKVNIDREADINHLVQKDLKTVAKLADFDPEEFGSLNAAYRKATLSKRKAYSFLLPIGHANKLHQSLAFLAQSSEENTLSAVLAPEAALFSFPALPEVQSPLLAINFDEDKQNKFALRSFASSDTRPNSATDEQARTKTTIKDYLAVHYLDKGESLKAIAQIHGISEAALREINKFKRRQSISLGQRLLIPLKQKWL
jgi:soluble lytic murein transglycosylase-like protein